MASLNRIDSGDIPPVYLTMPIDELIQNVKAAMNSENAGTVRRHQLRLAYNARLKEIIN